MEEFNCRMQCRKDEPLDTVNCDNNYSSEGMSSDVEKALMESQESILNSIDPISNCQDNSFLHPINDLLGDICELNKNFGLTNQLTLYSQQPTPNNTLGSSNCSWSDPSSSYFGVSTSTNSQDNIGNDNSYLNLGGTNDAQLLLPEATFNADFPNPDCSFFSGDYASSLNQLFQSLDQQQLSLMSAGCSTIPNHQTHSFSESFLSTIGSLPASTTITPISIDERNIGPRDISADHQDLTIEARFLSKNQLENENCQALLVQQNIPQQYEELNSFVKQNNLMGLESVNAMGQVSTQVITLRNHNESSQPLLYGIQNCGSQNFCFNSQRSPPVSSDLTYSLIPKKKAYKNSLNWTAVFPRKQLVNPSEMIIMHPFRTRKLMASRRVFSTATTIDLSDYFDTSSINIPMIRERPRSNIRNENRRKQKFNTIPGAENLIFEVQRNLDATVVPMPVINTTKSKLDLDPYPETELPELEEIFKRKKRTTLLACCTKRGQNLSTVNDASQKKLSSSNSYSQKPNVQESSTSFEEKISVSIAIRQGRSKMSLDSISDSSGTDSGENDYDLARVAKSLKCIKCMKLFKTNRSLAIHVKRCAVKHTDTSYSTEEIYSPEKSRVSNMGKGKLINDTLEICYAHSERQECLKVKDNNNEMKERPITRSQTRRSTYRVIPRLTKRTK